MVTDVKSDIKIITQYLSDYVLMTLNWSVTGQEQNK
jgi:hypothetical protein